ncbi:MAG: hypothetical protein H6719_07935 [Sandaracinaceae bacterium]|nr:hypothetical protein [Sandaracinaceae bacterium]
MDPAVIRRLREILAAGRGLEASDDDMGHGYHLQLAAEQALAKLGPRSVPTLVTVVTTHGYSRMRAAAARALGRLADHELGDVDGWRAAAIEALERASADASPAVVESASRALRRLRP